MGKDLPPGTEDRPSHQGLSLGRQYLPSRNRLVNGFSPLGVTRLVSATRTSLGSDNHRHVDLSLVTTVHKE